MMKNLRRNMLALLTGGPLTFLVSFFVCISFAKAQIVYTDINPDVTYNTIYYLDLNGDGINDFYFNCTSLVGGSSIAEVDCFSYDNNKIACDASGYPLGMSLNDTIDSDLTWIGASGLLYLESYTYHIGTYYLGNCDGDNYIGLKLIKDGLPYYGWIHLNVSTNTTLYSAHSSFILRDYAYNSVSGQQILAGQTCPPLAQVVADGPTTFCDGDSVILSSVSSGNTLSYQWKKNNVNIPGATSKNYTATTPGRYKVTVTDFLNGCSKSSAKKKVNVPCKLYGYELSTDIGISIAPNPFSYSTTISFDLEESENIMLNIYDLNGRLIKSLANKVFEEGVSDITWNATDENENAVSEGIYFLKMQTSNKSSTIRLLVIK